MPDALLLCNTFDIVTLCIGSEVVSIEVCWEDDGIVTTSLKLLVPGNTVNVGLLDSRDLSSISLNVEFTHFLLCADGKRQSECRKKK